MGQLDDIRDLYARRAVAAGVATYTPDGRVQLPDGSAVKVSPGEAAAAAMAREKVPSVVDLSSGLPEHTIVLSRAGGEKVYLHPLITAGYIRNHDWFSMRIRDIYALKFPISQVATETAPELRRATPDYTEYQRLDKEHTMLLHAQARLAIPDLPDGLLDELAPHVFVTFTETLDALTAEALEAEDAPNPTAAPGA